MSQTAIELNKLLEALPKNDRGFSWELRDYRGNERLECYNSLARAFKYILDNTDEVIAALSALTQGGVEGLEWKNGEARSSFGDLYSVHKLSENVWTTHWNGAQIASWMSTGEAAKVAALEHYQHLTALSTKLQEPVGEPYGYVIDEEKFVQSSGAAYNFSNAGSKVVSVYLAHQPVTAGWEKALADAVRKLGLEELVHGWHASGAYDKHPDALGVTLPTNCGTVYAIVAALKSEGCK